MTNGHGVVARLTCAIVQEDSYTPIQAVMFYDMNKPFEVVFASADGTEDGQAVEWHYSRDLLKAALEGEEKELHGEGDVIISIEDQYLFTLLQSQLGRCLVAFAKEDMRTFLELTTSYVPFGAEQVDMDDELRELLGE